MEIVLNEIGLALLLGLVALVTFLVMNLFSNSLTPKSYDQALEELKAKEKRSPEKSPKKKSKKPKRGSIVADSDDEDQTETESSLKSKRKPSLTVNLRQHVSHFNDIIKYSLTELLFFRESNELRA